MTLFHTIVHPTDFDAPSKEAFRVARNLAQLLGAKLVAFHVTPPPAILKEDGQVIVDPKNPTPTDFWADYRSCDRQPRSGGPVLDRDRAAGRGKEDAVWSDRT